MLVEYKRVRRPTEQLEPLEGSKEAMLVISLHQLVGLELIVGRELQVGINRDIDTKASKVINFELNAFLK